MKDLQELLFNQTTQPLNPDLKEVYKGNGAVVLAGQEGLEARFRALDPDYKVFKDITGYMDFMKGVDGDIDSRIGLNYNKRLGDAEVNLDYNTKNGYSGGIRYGNGPIGAGVFYDEKGKLSGQAFLNVGNAQFSVSGKQGSPAMFNANYNLPMDTNVNLVSQGERNSGLLNKQFNVNGTNIGMGLGFLQNPKSSRTLASIGFGSDQDNGWYGNIQKLSGFPVEASIGYRYKRTF